MGRAAPACNPITPKEAKCASAPSWAAADTMAETCPKCASFEVHPVGSMVDGGGTPRLSSRYPRRRRTEVWVLLASLFAIALVSESGGPSFTRALLLVLTVIVWTVAEKAWTYNSKELPSRVKRWQHGIVCGRCGNVFEERISE